jgi:hypothetical protein
MVTDPDADAIYEALQEIHGELIENGKRIKLLAKSGGMDHETLVLEVTETLLPILTDLSGRIVEAMADTEDEDDEAEGDEDEDDEGEGSVLNAEDAESLAKLLTEYRDSVQLLRNAETGTEGVLALDDKLVEIGNALRLITEITDDPDLEPDEEANGKA